MKYDIQKLNSIKNKIIEKVDLIDVAKELLNLNDDDVKENASRFVLSSPFRDDGVHPSFHIMKDSNRWNDRASGESGDLFDFVMRVNECGFSSAFKFLAEKAGVDISEISHSLDDKSLSIDAVINFIVNICAEELKRSENITDWFFNETGISEIDLIKYRVGYCPSHNWLLLKLRENFEKIDDEFLSSIGLLGDVSHRYEGAVVFPITSSNGRYNRIFTKPRNKREDSDPKYWSQYFTGKAKEHFDDGALFGLGVIRSEILKSGHVVVCEGYKQAMASHGCCIMGVNFTPGQVNTLKQLGATQLTILFDGDTAGHESSLKLIKRSDIIDGMEVYVARPPEGKQADNILKDEGREALKELISNSESLFNFALDNIAKNSEDYHSCLYAAQRIAKDLNPAHIFYIADNLGKRFSVSPESIKDWLFENISEANAAKLINNSKAETDLCVYISRSNEELDVAKLNGVHEKMFTSEIRKLIFEVVNQVFDHYGEDYTLQNVLDFVETSEKFKKHSHDIKSLLNPDYKFKYEPAIAVRLVVEYNTRRILKSKIAEMDALVPDISFNYNDYMERLLSETMDNADEDILPSEPIELIEAVEKRIDEARKNNSGVLGYDISSVSKNLNDSLSGICKFTYTVIGGQTGTGKSLLCSNIVRPLLFDLGLPVLWINLEMDPISLVFRFLAMESGLSESLIKLGRLPTKEDNELLEFTKEKYKKTKLFFDRPKNPTPEAIYSMVKNYHRKNGICLAVIDYIQLVAKSKSNESREENIGRMSKIFVNNITQSSSMGGLPVLAVSQQNRDKSTSRSSEGVGGSYQISQDAQNLILVSKTLESQDVPSGANRLITIAKARNGQDGIDFPAIFELSNPDCLRYRDFHDLDDF